MPRMPVGHTNQGKTLSILHRHAQGPRGSLESSAFELTVLKKIAASPNLEGPEVTMTAMELGQKVNEAIEKIYTKMMQNRISPRNVSALPACAD